MTKSLKNTIKYFVLIQVVFVLLLAVSQLFYINFIVAFFASFFIMAGTMYSYKRVVEKGVENGGAYTRDALEKIDDPYDLYDEEIPPEDSEKSLKEIVKEEKARIKKNGGVKHMKTTLPAMFSLYRLVPYGFLFISFLALYNNQALHIAPYLIGITAGIIAGALFSRGLA